MHPILEKTVGALAHGPGGTFEFTRQSLEQLQTESLALDSGEQLFDLAGELVTFAGYLHHKGSTHAAEDLLERVEVIVERLGELASVEIGAERDRAEQLQRAVGQQRRALQKSPGASGAIAPSGSKGVSLRGRKR